MSSTTRPHSPRQSTSSSPPGSSSTATTRTCGAVPLGGASSPGVFRCTLVANRPRPIQTSRHSNSHYFQKSWRQQAIPATSLERGTSDGRLRTISWSTAGLTRTSVIWVAVKRTNGAVAPRTRLPGNTTCGTTLAPASTWYLRSTTARSSTRCKQSTVLSTATRQSLCGCTLRTRRCMAGSTARTHRSGTVSRMVRGTATRDTDQL
mmetsp:Transcript_1500/g.3900  ORF Transcript_1500/g.3900 Transcript_1500/m.3900 type:complete len:206 (+) Transcript_1500:331-948(+)